MTRIYKACAACGREFWYHHSQKRACCSRECQSQLSIRNNKEAFLSRVSVDQVFGCWLWTGQKNIYGYGTVATGRKFHGMAHAIAWKLFKGEIPAGCEIDHLCKNHGCVNPDHLDPVSHAVNVERGDGGWHNRVKTHCPRGHPYNGANLYVIPSTGSRLCAECQREHKRAYKESRRARRLVA